MPTSGVLPISPRIDSSFTRRLREYARCSAAGDGGKDRDLVAVGDRRVEELEVSDVVVVAVDVHELVEPAVVSDQVLGQPRITSDELVEHLTDRRALFGDGR